MNLVNFRDAITDLESSMQGLEKADIKTFHHFAKGIYLRAILIPAGSTITGKIHKTEHLNILARGSISIATEEGSSVLHGTQIILSQPGTKRAGFAHTDCVWITVHATEETDIETLEAELVTDDYLSLEETKVIE